MPKKFPDNAPHNSNHGNVHVDRDRTGQRRTNNVVTCDVPKHSALLQHQSERQRKRNVERYRRLDENSPSTPHADKVHSMPSTTKQKKYVGFHFVFGSDRHGNCIRNADDKSPHENMTLTYEIAFHESEGFKMSVFRDHVVAVHKRNLRAADRTPNSNKAETLRAVSTVLSASVHNWLDGVDEDEVRKHVQHALDTHGFSIMDVHAFNESELAESDPYASAMLGGEGLIGHVRISPNMMRLP